MLPCSTGRDQGSSRSTPASAQVLATRRDIHSDRELVGAWLGKDPVLVSMSIGRQGVARSCTVENVSADSRTQTSRLKNCDISGALNIKEREPNLPTGLSHDFFTLRIHPEPRDPSNLGRGNHPHILPSIRGKAQSFRSLDLCLLSQREGH